MNNKVYIYNLKQAYFYIKQGIEPISIDKHKKTGKIYFVFSYKDTKEVYDNWVKRNK